MIKQNQKTKTVAIVQSNYIPWKGYFDLINKVDEFILFDDRQYTRRDWRNRNKIKTANGLQWLSIPVENKGKYEQLIKDTQISDSSWAHKHWQTIEHNYRKAPYFKQYEAFFKNLYQQATDETYLSKINFLFIHAICDLLDIKTRLSWSMDYAIEPEDKTDRLIQLTKAVSGTHYISGPAAKDYIDNALFENNNIKLSFMDYSGYLEYPQLYDSFDHAVTIIDLIFNTGPKAREYALR